MKTLNCPWCGEQPQILGAIGIVIISCLSCSIEHGAHGQTGRTVSQSKAKWNQFVVEKLREQVKP